MSTATIPVRVTWCPPSSSWGYSHGGSKPSFDRCQFAGRRAKAVSAESHISFSDFGSMHVTKRQIQQVRRLETPSWAMEDAKLGEAVLAYLENRFRIRDGHGSNFERLARIDEKARQGLPWMRRTLKRLLIRYHDWCKWRRKSQERIDKLEVQITHMHSEILLLERGVAAKVTCAVWLYFRCGWNSVEIAHELNVKAPSVRQWLARVREVTENNTARAYLSVT
jgi:hypothetical protein